MVRIMVGAKYSVNSADFLRSTAAGAALATVGLDGDLELCAALDRYSLVPEMKEKQISIPGTTKEA